MAEETPKTEAPKSFWQRFSERFVKKEKIKEPEKEKPAPAKKPAEAKISKEQARVMIEQLENNRKASLEGRSETERAFINKKFDGALEQIYARINRKELFKLEKAEDYIDLIRGLSSQERRALELEKEYGKGLWGRFKTFLAGEHDFDILENGDIKRHYWNEFARKALTSVFNRRTALQGGALAVIGILTGGIGAGTATILGSVAGRGGVEVWESTKGKEGTIRREVAGIRAQRWAELRNIAKDLHNPELSQEEKNNKIADLVERYCALDTAIMNQNEELQKAKQETDALREKWTKIGAWAGLGTSIFAHGFLTGLTHLKEIFTRLDINGDRIFHNVGLIDGKWHFFYDSAQELAAAKSAGATIVSGKAHVITSEGAGWAQYFWGMGKNLLRDFGVLAATYLAGIKRYREMQPLVGGRKPEPQVKAGAEKILASMKEKWESVKKEKEETEKKKLKGEEKQKEEERKNIERIKKYFHPGQIFGIKIEGKIIPFRLKEITDEGGTFYQITSLTEGKLIPQGKKFTWQEIIEKKIFEQGFSAYDFNLLKEGVMPKNYHQAKEMAYEMEENYKWLEKNKENLKFFEIREGQKIYAITGEESTEGYYEVEDIDTKKNTLWLRAPGEPKSEVYLSWFLKHKTQFRSVKPGEKEPTKPTPEKPKTPSPEPLKAAAAEKIPREEKRQEGKKIEASIEQYIGKDDKPHLRARYEDGTIWISDGYKESLKPGETVKGTLKKSKKGWEFVPETEEVRKAAAP